MEVLLYKTYEAGLYLARHMIRMVLFGGPACYLAASIVFSWRDEMVKVEDYLRQSVKFWVIGASLLMLIEWFNEPETLGFAICYLYTCHQYIGSFPYSYNHQYLPS